MVRNVIIDTDPGVDDAMAIMMALEAHIKGQIIIKAFTLAFGNATIDNCIQNLGAILSFYPPECLKVNRVNRNSYTSQLQLLYVVFMTNAKKSRLF